MSVAECQMGFFFSYIMERTSYIGWDDDVRFALSSASLFKQQSAGRRVAPLRHIILIPRKLVCARTP
jgi:hypothetical protein